MSSQKGATEVIFPESLEVDGGAMVELNTTKNRVDKFCGSNHYPGVIMFETTYWICN